MKLIEIINKIHSNEEVPEFKMKIGNKIKSFKYKGNGKFTCIEDSNFMYLKTLVDKCNNDLNYELNTKKEIKLHDIIKYANIEWYVIDIRDNEVKLMAKDIIGTMKYSDDNSNDWKLSKVRNYIDNWLTDTDLLIEDLEEMQTNYDEEKFSTDLIRIPTLREIEKLPMNIRNCESSYWTMTASYGVSEDCSYARVFVVYSNGYLGYNRVSDTYGVRPVISLTADKL